MRHLPALPFAIAGLSALAACAAPAPPPPQSPRAFALEPGAQARLAPGLVLRFDAVDDSRCPPGVQCVWAGRLSCRFSLLRDGAAPEPLVLAPGDAGHAVAGLGGAQLVLDESSLPAPAAPGAVPNQRVTVKLLPRPSSSPP